MIGDLNILNIKSRKINVPEWIKSNKSNFLPPICNKLMFRDQLQVMFVGGPNIRKDYHLNEGEEFFYQIHGNIELLVFEHGEPKTVKIKQGCCFLLPSCIPHSPQRPEDGSVGLVIERQRLKSEIDGMRWYCKDGKNVLWERWFQCYNLGMQLGPIVKEFQDSEESRTDIPNLDLKITPPMIVNVKTKMKDPVNLEGWVSKNKTKLVTNRSLIFLQGIETLVLVETGPYNIIKSVEYGETWIYQKKGNCNIYFPNENKPVELLTTGDCMLIEKNRAFELNRSENSLGIIINMRCRNKINAMNLNGFK